MKIEGKGAVLERRRRQFSCSKLRERKPNGE